MGKESTNISIKASLTGQLESWLGATNVSEIGGIPCATMVIRLTTDSPVNSIRVTIHVPSPLAVTQKDFVIPTLCMYKLVYLFIYLSEYIVHSSYAYRAMHDQ